MKILLTADPDLPVPPTFYGGIERIIDGLAHQYKEAGHRVWLCAHESSSSTAIDTLFTWPGKTAAGKADTLKNSLYLNNLARDIRPDIIHSFSRLLYLYPLLLSSHIPVVQSYQRAINPKSTTLAKSIGGKKLHFTACAAHMVEHLDWKDKWHIIPNFTDVQYFTPGDKHRTYLAFLGRIEPIKGAAEAVQVALKSGWPLKIAGNIPLEHQGYFDKEVQPFLSKQIEYIGPVNDEEKRNLLQGAIALLFPILWEEPFGIVMVESMACGAPVIAFDRGSVSEVIEDDRTGFIVQDIEGMINSIRKIKAIDNKYVRTSAYSYFSKSIIGEKYLSIFNNISSNKYESTN